MAKYSATTLQAFIPSLVETLMVQQPPDPVSFLRTHLDALVTDRFAANAEESPPSPRTAEVRQLRTEVAKLRSENKQLQLSQERTAAAAMRKAREATVRACNWNLAGVNENPFEFLASRDERFPRVTKFIHDVDAQISQVLFTPDPESDEGDEAQVKAVVTEQFAAEVRGMQLSELLKGLLVVAQTVGLAQDDGSSPGGEVDTLAQIRSKRRNGRLRCTTSIAEQNWKDVDTDGDGVADAVAYDINSDGNYHALDLDMDGKIDFIMPSETTEGAAVEWEPLAACTLGARELSLAATLEEIVTGEPAQLLDCLHRGLSTGFFSSPDLKLKDRTWTLTNARSDSVTKFLASCCMCFAETGEVPVEVDEKIWWQHWLRSVCKAWPAEKDDELPRLAFPLATFDVLLAKIGGRLIAKMDANDTEAFLQEMKQYVEAMRTTSEAKARVVANGCEWTLHSYSPSAIALQEFNAGWMAEPSFQRFWTDYVDGTHAVGGGYEVVTPLQIKNRMQQTLLLLKKGDHTGLRKDQKQTRLLVSCIEDQAELTKRLRTAFRTIYPEPIVEMQVEKALGSLTYKCAAAVCTLHVESSGDSLASSAELESVLVVAAHAASDGTDNRAIIAAVKELALWLSTLPEVNSVPRIMVMMDANSATTFPRKGVDKGAASQAVFRKFLQNDSTLSASWFARDGGDSAAVQHTVMKERTHLQTQVCYATRDTYMVIFAAH